MKRIISYGAIVLGVYLAFLIGTFPASRAFELTKDMLPQVQLYDVSGTVWSGKTEAVVINGKPLREFEWSIRPWNVFLGRLEADVAFDNNTAWAKGKMGLSLNGNVVVTDLTGLLPAADVQAMLPKAPARLDGSFRLTMDKLVYSPEQNNVLTAEGHVDWQSASITVMQEVPIGDFQLDLTTTSEAGINGIFSDVNDGPLIVQGNVTLSPEKQYTLDAKLKVRDASRRDLVQSLQFLGRPDAEGNVTFKKTGTL